MYKPSRYQARSPYTSKHNRKFLNTITRPHQGSPRYLPSCCLKQGCLNIAPWSYTESMHIKSSKVIWNLISQHTQQIFYSNTSVLLTLKLFYCLKPTSHEILWQTPWNIFLRTESHSYNQEIPLPSWNPKIHYCVHRSLPELPILIHIHEHLPSSTDRKTSFREFALFP